MALLEKGADVNVKEDVGCMPLHYACANGRVEIVLALLVKGANFNAEDNDGYTHLLHARGEGHIEIAGMLRLATAQLENAAGER